MSLWAGLAGCESLRPCPRGLSHESRAQALKTKSRWPTVVVIYRLDGTPTTYYLNRASSSGVLRTVMHCSRSPEG
jgi:hypothetical protein